MARQLEIDFSGSQMTRQGQVQDLWSSNVQARAQANIKQGADTAIAKHEVSATEAQLTQLRPTL